MANNPFYIEPADFTPGFQALTEGVGSRIEYLREEDKKKKQQAKLEEIDELVRAGDADKVSSWMMKNPWAREHVESVISFKDDQLKQGEVDKVIDVLSGQVPIQDYLMQSVQEAQAKGEDPTPGVNALKFADQDPEAAKKNLETLFALSAPARYNAYKKATQGAKVDTTSEMKNWGHYQTLLRENPTQAAKFATQTGITKSVPDDRTTAIKEFEYGAENPSFKLAQVAKDDAAKSQASAGKTFDNTEKLRKEFLSQSKEYQKVRDSYTRVLGSTLEPSPAGDLSLIFNYMKMLDPGSVVRESEFRTAATSGSYGARMQATVNKVISGERLADSMRADFVDKAKVLFDGMQKQHRKREATYRGLATKNKLSPNDVVVDLDVPGGPGDKRPASELTVEELRERMKGGQ